MPVELDEATSEGWLLGLYGHPGSIDQYGTLEDAILFRASDPTMIHAWIDALRGLDLQRVAIRARERAVLPYRGYGVEAALERLEQDAAQGTLEWRLDDIERRGMQALHAELEHHRRVFEHEHEQGRGE